MLKRAVVTGLGVVSPNGIGKAAFCKAILAGQSGVKQITRFDTSELPVKIAGEVQDFNELDWMEARERKHVSRAVPLALAAATEALSDAGIDATKLSLNEQREIGVVLGTGCASSTDAIGHALRQVQLGTQPVMLVGGVDAPLAWGIMKAFTLMKIMTESWNDAPQRRSRPFSKDRDGFVVAEGAWLFVVEEYEHARSRGAGIYAEITGYGSTCEAFHRVRLQECGEEPARAIQLAMQESGISAQNVHYVNLHGTSTQLNDRIETRALKLALGDHAYKVPMSALKSQIGHPQGACGAAGVAATLIAMHHGEIPPTINIENPDPECDLDYVPQPGRKVQIEHAVC